MTGCRATSRGCRAGHRGTILLALTLLVASCLTTGPEPQDLATLAESRLGEVTRLVDSGAFLEAFQAISLLRFEKPDGVADADLSGLESKASDALVKAFRDSLSENDHDKALSLVQSAKALGRSDLLAPATERSIRGDMAARLSASGEFLQATLARLPGIEAADVSAEELTAAYAASVKADHHAAARLIARLMEARGMQVPDSFARAAPPAFPTMLTGTVTILVNRGIRLENGIGYPDRVIGSGFFVDRRGYILTNYHVIKSEVDPTYEGYSRLFVQFSESTGEKVPAAVVGYDTVFDLALIKAATEAEYVFGGAGETVVSPGDRVYAIGSPAGLEKTITSGIVSATGRRFLPLGDTIQVDVPLNPGNSGGPLLDQNGDLIGVVFAGLEEFEGLNFAIPYRWIEKVLPRLFKGGAVSHAWLGMALSETEKGLEVIYVLPGEPAEKAGVRQGDIINAINGTAYTTMTEVQAALLPFGAPALVQVTILRDGARREAILCLAARPPNPIELALKRDTRDSVIYPLFGIKLLKVSTFLWKSDYVVTRVIKGSSADEAGLSVDDPLTIQDWSVDSKNGYAILQVYIKKRRAGFMESVLQMGTYLETNNFL